MQAKVKYRSYPQVVKHEIAQTRNIYLFPELGIPRTTAQYWIKKKNRESRPNFDKVESLYKKKSDYLEIELKKEKALRILLETVRKIFPYDFKEKHLKSKPARSRVVEAIRECLKHHKLSLCLNAIGLSKSTYQRWASEISFCAKTKSLCERRQALQLTTEEVNGMKKYVTSKKYAHISVSSLHLLVQRNGELFCSIGTWYKYIHRFGWKRPWKVHKRMIQKTGIRTTRPNEVWHIDVTVVNIRPGLKLYIQAVIDNYSRFVLAWRVTDEINANNTVETLALARKKSEELLSSTESTKVMMDPGSENKNGNVLKFINSKNLSRLLARVDIHYSNSMIECLFRMFKNNYLYHQGIKTIEDLTRKSTFYFREHNDVIPLALHNGGRPSEIYRSAWNERSSNELQEQNRAALVARKMKNLGPVCGICPAQIAKN